MHYSNDIIELDNSQLWEKVVTLSRQANVSPVNPNYFTPMSAIDLEVSLNNPYFAIAIQSSDALPHWRYGGRLYQSWNFSKGGAIGSAFSKAQSIETKLGLNIVQIIRLEILDIDNFRLRYFPPRWFKDVIVFGWKYIGDVDNFTADTLFEIGNKLGSGTTFNPDSIGEQVETLLTSTATISDRLIELEDLIVNSGISNEAITAITQQISTLINDETAQINQRINSLSNDLADVLSGNENPEILYRDSLDEEL